MNIAITQQPGAPKEGYIKFLAERYKEADRNTSYFVYAYFVLGLILAFFYDTWSMALGIGGACLGAYLLCQFFAPGTLLSRMVTAATFAFYMLQFIGQMHGMYEMHFFFFINIAILIIYQDWRILLPYTLIAAVHHGVLFGLQMSGYDVRQYIISLDTISYTTIFFHLGLVVLMAVVCGWWSIVLQKRSRQEYQNQHVLENQLENMQKNISFSSEISKGNLTADYELNSDDLLGKSLVSMRSSLLEAAKKEEQERFKNIGLAEISDILRNNSDSLQEIANLALARIIKYMGINQGGLFILENSTDEPYLELLASYAYNRKKYLNKKVAVGEGLLGQAVLEKDTVLLTDIPRNYVSITSGLGEATPNCILIVPIKYNEQVVGVMELASFRVLQAYEVAFLEKLSETIASTIISVQVNQKTKLLLEQSQIQAEELRAQEEEMRQNMEELEATQEEMRRKEIDIRGQLMAVDNTLATVEFDMQGCIRSGNDAFLRTMGYSLEEIRGKHHRMFCEQEYARSVAYTSFWHKLNQGHTFHDEFRRIGKNGKDVWLRATYTPVLDSSGLPYKVIKLAFDVTEEKQRSLDIQAKIEAVNNSNAVVEFTPQGSIIRTNQIFQDLLKYSDAQLTGKHHNIFISAEERNTAAYQQHWNRLAAGEMIQGEFRRVDKEGKTIWIRGTYNPVYGLSGKVVKIIKVAQDITAEKLLWEQKGQHTEVQDQKVHQNGKMKKDLDVYLKALNSEAVLNEADQ